MPELDELAIAAIGVVFALGGLGVAVAIGRVVVARASRRCRAELDDLAARVRAAAAGEPPRALAGPPSPEVAELVRAFELAVADLTALRRRLAAIERIAARREIARRVAHEIKNPLVPIRAAVETLRRLKARGDPAFDDYFDEASRTVLEEVGRIASIVTEFTQFSRLPAPDPRPLELVEAVRGVVGLHAGGDVVVELVAEPCPIVHADRDQMVQVVTNLVQNALDAARERPAPRVRVEVRPAGAARVALSVTDTGPGVAPEMRERLFEPYATTKPAGTGLGLAIVHRIVLEHGGDITYTDAPGGGARFELVLPTAGPALLAEPPTLTATTGLP
ncbi:MAG: GHKL domain-containing protein [Polyangiaceae bacterium]|nr:GHKL domain-containing protein [Polyangiaceae bacterium]